MPCSDASTTNRWCTRWSRPTRPTPAAARARRRGAAMSATRTRSPAPEGHGPRPRRGRREPAVARRRQDFPEFARRELLAEAESQDVSRRHVLDPVAARPGGAAEGRGELRHGGAQDQASRAEIQENGHSFRAGDHRRRGPEPVPLRAQSAQGAHPRCPPRRSGVARPVRSRDPDEEGDGEIRGDPEMNAAAPKERLMQVLLAPLVSEKSTFIGEKHNQYVFHVAADATKPEIKAAVELMFKTKVKSVQVANVGGKEKRFGRYVGHRRRWKKAYVSLAQGQEISFQAPE